MAVDGRYGDGHYNSWSRSVSVHVGGIYDYVRPNIKYRKNAMCSFKGTSVNC